MFNYSKHISQTTKERSVMTMKRFHIFKDGVGQGSCATKESAMDLIRQYQIQEPHQFLKANFSIIEGEEEFIPYRRKPEEGTNV